MRIHICTAVSAILFALVLPGVAIPAPVKTLEVCCSTMGECPEGYKCCARDGDACHPDREGYCSTSCPPVGGE